MLVYAFVAFSFNLSLAELLAPSRIFALADISWCGWSFKFNHFCDGVLIDQSEDKAADNFSPPWHLGYAALSL